MKRALKLLGVFVAVVIVCGAGGVAYVVFALPRVAPADQTLKIEPTPARVARGEYIAKSVAACEGCHSVREWGVFGHPIRPGTEFQGGDSLFDTRIGLPGSVYPKNITPYNLKHYSDGELVRVLRTGVERDGQPLFPLMPYTAFSQMDQEDLYSVIAYLRTLPEKVNDVPPHHLEPPVNVLVHLMPKEAPPFPKPADRSNSAAYGAYLVTISSCGDCHTPVDAKNHAPIPGMLLAGGREFGYLNDKLQANPRGGVLRVPNITPDSATGIGSWSKAMFLARFASWRGDSGRAKLVTIDFDRGDYLPLMPYAEFAGMTDDDLGAIYDYLRTIPAVHHPVVRFDPPKPR